MSNQVDRCGTFRFDKVLECGVSLTKNKFPSFNIRVRLSEFYDEDENTWVDWLPAEAEQTAYFILFGKSQKTGAFEPCLNHTQVMKVFNWDGNSFQILANDDYSQIKGQLRIGDNTYEGAKSPFQVEWLDVFDADPVRTLRKLEDGELKDLDARFAQALKQTGKAAPVATTRKSGPKPPAKKPATPPEKETTEPELTEAEKKAALKAKSAKNKAAAKGKKPGPPAARKPDPEPDPDPPADTTEEGGKEYTKQEAWEIVVEMKDDAVTDEQLNEAWNDAIDAVAGEGADQKEITKQQWGKIVDMVLDTEYEDGKTIGKF
jgi:hypothetical protein